MNQKHKARNDAPRHQNDAARKGVKPKQAGAARRTAGGANVPGRAEQSERVA